MKTPASKLLLVAVACGATLISAASVQAQSKPGWTENEAQALSKAKADRKMVLMDFTGSDWCGWCMKMDKEVFATPEFQNYAKDNLVLVELDYPHQKLLAPATIQQNEALKQQYGIHGFPTLVVLDADGKTMKSFVGYQQGGASAFISQLKALKP